MDVEAHLCLHLMVPGCSHRCVCVRLVWPRPVCSRFGSSEMAHCAGEILVKAWQSVGDEQREHLEADCVQALMKAAILARTPQLHVNLVRVLRAFHREKAVAAIDSMLHRLYEPILWRHLNAANAQVRSNALSLMFEAFPIQVRAVVLLSADTGQRMCMRCPALRAQSASSAFAAWGCILSSRLQCSCTLANP
jgi:Condensin II non structural maintenance of chromosomes subunit